MKTRIPPVLITFALVCFALVQNIQAVSPAPDGGYPGFTTAEGQNALKNLTTGQANTALGWFSLFSATTGSFNTGVGAGALALNNGDANTAVGVAALLLNTTGIDNTATGEGALQSNTTGSNNTATGFEALLLNTEGLENAADGAFALTSNTTGVGDTATGQAALFSNTTGNNNTACGLSALLNNTTANGNTAVGAAALFGNLTGSNNIALGFQAGQNLTTGDNNIDIGNQGVAVEANTIRIGTQGTQTATYIAGVYLTVLPITVPVAISVDGQLGEPQVSSARFKDDIKPMDDASEAILALKPVRFHYKREIDPSRTSQFGLVAEDVEKVNPDLIVRDKEGKPYTVRYDQVNAMLLNEFLKEHRTVQEQQKEIDTLKAELKEQKAQIQKVSAQLELRETAPQTVLNNR